MIASMARAYINRIIQECDSDLDELPFSFNPTDSTPETLQECSYHLGFTDVVNVDNSTNQSEDDLTVDITFMKSGYQCEIEEHEAFIDKIYCIKNALVNLINYDSGIIKVSAPTLSIADFEGTDNIMVINLQIIVKINVCF